MDEFLACYIIITSFLATTRSISLVIMGLINLVVTGSKYRANLNLFEFMLLLICYRKVLNSSANERQLKIKHWERLI